MNEPTEIKTRNTDKKRIEALEASVQDLTNKMNMLVSAVRQSAHAMGWPPDLLEKHGIKPFDKETETMNVMRVGGR